MFLWEICLEISGVGRLEFTVVDQSVRQFVYPDVSFVFSVKMAIVLCSYPKKKREKPMTVVFNRNTENKCQT